MSLSTKMYICIREDFPDFMAPTLVGHAVLRHALLHKDLPDCYEKAYEAWVKDSFRKCVVRLSIKEFDKARGLEGIVESWENNTLDGAVSCVTYVTVEGKPVPNVLKFAKLWKPHPGGEQGVDAEAHCS